MKKGCARKRQKPKEKVGTKMQSNKISFKGQNIYVGIDVHLKTWHVTTLTESGYKYSFAQHSTSRTSTT